MVKRRLRDKVEDNKRFKEGMIKQKRFAAANANKDNKKELPSDNIDAVFKSLGLQECLQKLKD